ncbi:cell envelope integrity EipB family protein [Mesorhizobium sp. ESP-6-4]|uniref:cell envelope integrity EipB family protein n=1 Tax=unclassified Mesorhizobium TaxID=325217 RepID=UPI000BAFD47C|nr:MULTISPECIES: cell envelope integrity EipB family protein [unclassified Mesorhizobium]MBZ9661095.1 cell envelope integrity EipB family protein [Mesorhizobium sp. ESP-6-4]MBZ9812210.1 cell envelope integrity EipB family protein [Mesorhizobium sp. CA7]MBZ9841830.1 cell envelope integrity EipB family protein [Mesorhizobium sp. CA5]MBZ9882658.1 cell envelope integrity EipB family protein [Mesorhizobium sp. CA10]MBZ9912437.1 cell envelope integrity EipB family protein [Mesorhizobium sp. CA16]
MRATRLFLAAACFSAMLPMAPALAVPALQAHRAVYDLTLNKASDRSGITGITGRMVYEFNGSACEGYTVKFRFVTQIATADGTKLTDQQTTTFEDAEGKTFSFVTKSFTDQNLDKEVKGTATREQKGLKVEIDKPEKNSLELAATQFPTQHLVELIGKAEKGENFYQTNLFDGSEDANKVMTTTVIVGKKTDVQKSDPEAPALAKLATDKYWPVDIAYFDDTDNKGEEVPEYRISFKLHENGITRDLVMDYGEFSMTGKLVNLSLFDQTKPCPASK